MGGRTEERRRKDGGRTEVTWGDCGGFDERLEPENGSHGLVGWEALPLGLYPDVARLTTQNVPAGAHSLAEPEMGIPLVEQPPVAPRSKLP